MRNIQFNQKSIEIIESLTDAEVNLAIELGSSAIISAKQALRTNIQQQGSVNYENTVKDIAVVKGQKGEEFVRKILQEKYGDALATTAKVSKSGDMQLNVAHKKIIVEIKNYENTVPKEQVEKFHRDIVATNCSGGIFISLKSPINSLPLSSTFIVRYDVFEDRILPVVYMVGSDPNIIKQSIEIAEQLAEAASVIKKDIYSQDMVSAGIYNVSNQLDIITKNRIECREILSTLFAGINKNQANLQSAECVMRDAIQSIKGELFVHTVIGGDDTPKEVKDFIHGMPGERDNVLSLVSLINDKYSSTITKSIWKVSAKKLLNVNSGYGFNIIRGKVEFIAPVKLLTPDVIYDAVIVLSGNASVDEHLHIIIDASTTEFIKDKLLA